MDLNKSNVAWVTPILGRDGKLFYMGPLLQALSMHSKKLQIYTAEFGSKNNDAQLNIHEAGRVHRFYFHGHDGYYKGFTIIGPGLIRALWRDRQDCVFVNEFSLMSLYTVICRMLGFYRTMVLVIENRPVQNDTGLMLRLKRIFRRFIARHADSILTNNKNGRQYAIDELGVQARRIVAKPYLVSQMKIPDNQIEEAATRFKQLNIGDVIHFLFVGRLIKQKGIQHMLAAFARLVNAGHTNFFVHIVGDGDYRESLEASAAETALGPFVQFHGQCDYENLTRYYLSAHVFVFPTLRDYRALAPFEAISAGLPIVGSIYDGGSVESVHDGENGFQIDPCNQDNFVAVLQAILQNPSRLAIFSENSRNIASAYTIENAVGAMLEAAAIAGK